MQAIQESNEHLKNSITHFEQVENPDSETIAYQESNWALIKAHQATAYALLAVANAFSAEEQGTSEKQRAIAICPKCGQEM